MKPYVKVCIAFWIVLVPLEMIAQARCAPPKFSINPEKVGRGTTVTVVGQGFWDHCNDVLAPGQIPPGVNGAKNIKILFKQGNISKLLVTVDADSSLRFSVNITIPSDASIGEATILADADIYQSGSRGNGDKPEPMKLQVIESVR
jgi:hypothetical protein